jgi:CRISPR-associated protein (Cas_Csd1)
MRINEIVLPKEIKRPYGYTPMDVAVEILLGARGQIGSANIKPLLSDDKTRMRLWLPDLPRTSAPVAIVGADKLDYYHPIRKSEAYQLMITALENMVGKVSELQWILDWMRSDRPLELEQQIFQRPKADADKLVGGRIIWRLEHPKKVDGKDIKYIHDLPILQAAHQAQTIERAGGNGDLEGTLPRIHSIKLPAPLLGCNDEMFRSWGQREKQFLNVSAQEAVAATQKYTQLLEAKNHYIRLDDNQYWVWGALPEMVEVSEANIEMAALMGSAGADLDPIQALNDLMEQIRKGAKALGKIPEDLKMISGYIGIGGSGEGRAAIGQMTEQSVLELLQNLQTYHQRQRRYVPRSNPYWTFGALTVAEGSSKKAIARANKQIFTAMLEGRFPPPTITREVIQRLKIEGVPSHGEKKTSRAWSQMAFLAWASPNVIKKNSTMKPDTSPENLLAWHVGRVFAQCKRMAFYYAHPEKGRPVNDGEKAKGKDEKGNEEKKDWRNPLDSYRQVLFSSPSQGFAQIIAKISPYLSARPDQEIWYHKALAELGRDCPGLAPPPRWTDEQAFFLALGISQVVEARFKKATPPDNDLDLEDDNTEEIES